MSYIDGFDDDSILSVGHLGIVAGAYDSLGIADIIDSAIPKTRHHNLSHSQVVKLMTLNGLGFTERRLYLFPEFFDDIAVERLLGEGITTDYINDDVLGKTLDAIAQYGPTELFNEIVANCLIPTEFGSHCIHVDTTNFSVTGKYESDFGTEEIEITYTHPKDGRWDLKRFVLGMASNQHGVPLYLQTFSRNESDKESLRIIVENLQNNLKSYEKVYQWLIPLFIPKRISRSSGSTRSGSPGCHLPSKRQRTCSHQSANLNHAQMSDIPILNTRATTRISDKNGSCIIQSPCTNRKQRPSRRFLKKN